MTTKPLKLWNYVTEDCALYYSRKDSSNFSFTFRRDRTRISQFIEHNSSEHFFPITFIRNRASLAWRRIDFWGSVYVKPSASILVFSKEVRERGDIGLVIKRKVSFTINTSWTLLYQFGSYFVFLWYLCKNIHRTTNAIFWNYSYNFEERDLNLINDIHHSILCLIFWSKIYFSSFPWFHSQHSYSTSFWT